MRYSKRLAFTAELHWFALCAVCTRKGCSSILVLFISFCADARNVSKTAQDACLYISEPPQSPTKPRGGKKGSGLPETTLAAAEALPASVTRKKDAGSQTAEGNRAPRAEGQPAPDAVAAPPKRTMPMQRPQSAA